MSLQYALDPPPASSSSQPDFDARSDAELDTLPFGVICLDRDGVVRRYNLAESRFARLDRAQVLGKQFYGVIAHCCDTPEFRGRIESYRDDPNQKELAFDYVFDFRFGAQLVEIEAFPSQRPGHVYITVTRKTFSAPRSDVPEDFLAIAQEELAPEESEEAVARDANQRRELTLSPVMFEALMTVLSGKDDAAALLTAWGVTWGRRAVIDLETEVMVDRDRVLRELTMSDAVDTIARYVERQGWGDLVADFAQAAHGAFVLELARNALAEALPRGHAPRCQLIAGFLEAMFGHIAGRRLCVREATCITCGADRCRFVVVGEGREAALDEVLAEVDGDMDRLAERLGGLA